MKRFLKKSFPILQGGDICPCSTGKPCGGMYSPSVSELNLVDIEDGMMELVSGMRHYIRIGILSFQTPLGNSSRSNLLLFLALKLKSQ